MEDNKTYKIGFAITGSFCTYEKIKEVIQNLKQDGMEIIPIFSDNAQNIDSRFGKAADFKNQIEQITGNAGICSIAQAEPIGPKGYLDALVLAPCTGNTLAKLNSGITDTPVLMAAKAHLRNEKPLVISVSTNDALGVNFNNIGELANRKNVYFVPFGQDDSDKKPRSMIARVELIPETIRAALEGKQIQPMLQSPL